MRKIVCAWALALFFIMTGPLSHAEGPPAHIQLNIESQPLGSALMMLAEQSGIQVLMKIEDQALERPTPALVGQFTVQEALNRLLAQSGFRYEFINDRTVAVHPKEQSSFDAKHGSGAVSEPQGLRLAEAESAPGNASVAAGAGVSAAAADSGSAEPRLEEVIVTAQKRAERLVDVPISIVALTADELQKREITRLDDLEFQVPGVAIESNGSQRRVVIRGISNYGGSNLPLVGLYLDEADVSSGVFSQLDISTYDLDRVEVLRGPQGTLYGEGSAGGTIRFITRDPKLDHFSLDLDAAGLITQDGSPSQRVNTTLNVPVIDNVLGFRIIGTFDHAGGWIDQPAADRKDINSRDLLDVRFKGLWLPLDSLSVKALAEVHRSDEGPNIGEDAAGNYTQQFGLTTTPRTVNNFNIFNLTLDYGFPLMRLLSATSYVNQHQDQRNFGWIFPLDPPPATPYGVVQSPVIIDSSALSQELRLASDTTGPWRWTVGAFYRNFKYTLYSETYFDLATNPLPLPPSPYLSRPDSESSSIFADTSYQFFNRLTLGVGGRYFQDQQSYVSGYPITTQSGRFHSVDPRVYAQYKLTNDVNVYASAAKGFRSGGFNQLNQPSFGPEDVWTYELGTKMALQGGRVTLDADIFYSDYTNYQITGILPPPAPPDDIYRNAGNAWIKGVEWDLAWSPVRGLSLSFNGDYLQTRFYKINLTETAYDVGDPLDYVPKYTMNLAVQRDFTWDGKSGFLRLDYGRQGRETYRSRSYNPLYFDQSDIINMLNANTTLQWSDRLSLSLFAQNLLNDRGFIDPDNIQRSAARNRPRTLGVEFIVKLD